MMLGGPGTPTALFEGCRQAAVRYTPRREDAEEEYGDHCRRDGERDHANVDPDVAQSRQRRRGQSAEREHATGGERDAERTADETEYGSFEHEIADDPPARCAEGGADRQLALARQVSHEEEIRDVGRADQQHTRGGGEERDQRGPGPAQRLISKPDGIDAPAEVGLRIITRETRGDHFEVGRRHVRRYPGLEACIDPEEVAPASLRDRARERQPRPELGDSRKSRRHYPNDRVRTVIEDQRLADGRWHTAQLPAPIAVADHDFVRAARVARQKATHDRRHAERREVVRCHTDRGHALGLLLRAHRDGEPARRGDGGKDGVLVAIIEIAPRGHRELRQAGGGIGLPDGEHPIRVANRERLEQYTIDEPEHRRGRADRDREGQNGRYRKSWAATQPTEHVTHCTTFRRGLTHSWSVIGRPSNRHPMGSHGCRCRQSRPGVEPWWRSVALGTYGGERASPSDRPQVAIIAT